MWRLDTQEPFLCAINDSWGFLIKNLHYQNKRIFMLTAVFTHLLYSNIKNHIALLSLNSLSDTNNTCYVVSLLFYFPFCFPFKICGHSEYVLELTLTFYFENIILQVILHDVIRLPCQNKIWFWSCLDLYSPLN